LRDGTQIRRIRWSENADGRGFSLENLLLYMRCDFHCGMERGLDGFAGAKTRIGSDFLLILSLLYIRRDFTSCFLMKTDALALIEVEILMCRVSAHKIGTDSRIKLLSYIKTTTPINNQPTALLSLRASYSISLHLTLAKS
jgi:hypothetical protein